MVFMLDILSDVWCFVKNNPQPVATLVASGVAVWVTWRFQNIQAKIAQAQADTAGHKLKLELYERRYRVYEAIHRITILNYNLKDHEFEFNALVHQTKEIKFLFSDDIIDFANKVISAGRSFNMSHWHLHSLERQNLEMDIREPASSQMKASLETKTKALAILDNARDQIIPKFSPYLSFETIK